MAIYHLSYKTGTRSGGQSGGAKYAYLTRTEQYEAGIEQVTYVEHAHYPTYVSDAADFWKAADAHERANGSLFVEVEVALPKELDEGQRLELAREYAEWLSYKMPTRETDQVAKGPLPYTIALHKGHKGENPHAHILLNERPTDGVERTLEATFKRVNREHPERGGAAKSVAFKHTETVREVRQEWEIRVNVALERAGHEARIDHRSYKEQGLEQEPGVHLGHRVTAMEREGIETERGNEQREIERRNRERSEEVERGQREGSAVGERAWRTDGGVGEPVSGATTRAAQPARGVEPEADEQGSQERERTREVGAGAEPTAGQVEQERGGAGEPAGAHKSWVHGAAHDVEPEGGGGREGGSGAKELEAATGGVRREPPLEALGVGGDVGERGGAGLDGGELGKLALAERDGEDRAGGVGQAQSDGDAARVFEQLVRELEQRRERARASMLEAKQQPIERAAPQAGQDKEREEEALRREVQRQEEDKERRGWKRVDQLEGKVSQLEQVYGHRVMVVEDAASKRYALVVDAQEREGRAQLNSQGKPEVVLEQASRRVEVGEVVRCSQSEGCVWSREREANNERMKMEREQRRQLDKDRGWER